MTQHARKTNRIAISKNANLLAWLSSTFARLRLQEKQRAKRCVSLILGERDVGVLVKTEYLRGVIDGKAFDVSHIALKSRMQIWRWKGPCLNVTMFTSSFRMLVYHVITGRINLTVDSRLWILMLILKDVWTVEVVQDAHETSPVPVVGNASTVVDVPSSVHQHLCKNNFDDASIVPPSKQKSDRGFKTLLMQHYLHYLQCNIVLNVNIPYKEFPHIL